MAQKKEYHHGNLRETLLETAIRHLKKESYESLSLRDLARQAGVSKTAPYRHFPDKTALFTAMAAEGFRRLNEKQEAALESQGGADLVEAYNLLGQVYVQFAVENGELYRLMFALPAEQVADFPELAEQSGLAHRRLSKSIEDAQAAGAFAQGDTQTATVAAWALVHGLSDLLNGRLLGKTPEDPAAFVKAVLLKLVTGLKGE